MAKRSKPPSSWLEALTEYDGQLPLHRRAERQRLFDDWITRLADRDPPTRQELRRHCQYMLDDPHRIERMRAPYIFLILQDWFAKSPAPKKDYTPKQIADLVDWVIDTENVPRIEACKKVQKAYPAITVHAVRQAHLRFGKSRRGKSQ